MTDTATMTTWFGRIGAITPRQRRITTELNALIGDLRSLVEDPSMTDHERTQLATAAQVVTELGSALVTLGIETTAEREEVKRDAKHQQGHSDR